MRKDIMCEIERAIYYNILYNMDNGMNLQYSKSPWSMQL